MLKGEQATALKLIMLFLNRRKSSFIIDGFAGTGKTYLLIKLLECLNLLRASYCVTSYTGKAVSNIKNRCTESGVFLYSAVTLHSLIYETHIEIEKMLDDEGNVVTDSNNKPILVEVLRYKKKTPDDIKSMVSVIIIDEGSMIPEKMYSFLMELEIPIIIFGDKEQLPPIGDSDFNIMKSEIDFSLKEVRRTSFDNPIFKLAYTIIKTGKLYNYDYGEGVNFISKSSFNKDFLIDNDIDIILCHSNNDRKYYNKLYRSAIFGRYGDQLPIKGERVIGLKNSRNMSVSNQHIYNGEIYTLFRDSEMSDKRELNLYINTACYGVRSSAFYEESEYQSTDSYNFSFGYAITVHKAQGSEFDNVVIILPNQYVIENFMNDYKAWIYTAVTRAKKNVWIVG